MASLDEEFLATAESVRSGKPVEGVPTAEKLQVYALYKQATEGDIPADSTQPYMVQFEARSKWDAWNAVKGTSKEDAKKKYIAEVKRQQAKYASS